VENRAPVVVSQTMVEKMKPGSVIIDGYRYGCFETSELTTHEKPTFVKSRCDSLLYVPLNFTPPDILKTASISLSNIFTHTSLISQMMAVLSIPYVWRED
jgi:alanine dehydrogenase